MDYPISYQIYCHILELAALVLQRLPGILSTKSNNCCALRHVPSHIFGEQWQRSSLIWAHGEFMFYVTFMTNRDYSPRQL